MSRLKPQSNEPLYSNTVTGTLAVDGWAVTCVMCKCKLNVDLYSA